MVVSLGPMWYYIGPSDTQSTKHIFFNATGHYLHIQLHVYGYVTVHL
jgi:hypothetical protein